MKNSLLLFVIAATLGATVPMRADGKLEPPVPVRTVAPEYPSDMRREGMSGLVMVSCLIDEHGNVTDTKIEKSSNEAFASPAIVALRKWKFKPAQRDGAVVPIHVTIPIKFSLNS